MTDWHAVVVTDDEIEDVHHPYCPTEVRDEEHDYIEYVCDLGYVLSNVGWDTIFPAWVSLTDEGRPPSGCYAVSIRWFQHLSGPWGGGDWDAEIEVLPWGEAPK